MFLSTYWWVSTIACILISVTVIALLRAQENLHVAFAISLLIAGITSSILLHLLNLVIPQPMFLLVHWWLPIVVSIVMAIEAIVLMKRVKNIKIPFAASVILNCLLISLILVTYQSTALAQ